MRWGRADFKDQVVWVAIDDNGGLVVEAGRVAIRYSKRSGAKIYRAGAARLTLRSDPPEELPEGSTDDAPSRAGRGRGFGKAGARTAAQATAARTEARRLIADLPEGTVLAFTDGACRGNPGPAGSGAVVRLADGSRREGCLSLGSATNNIAELSAIGLVLDMLEEAGVAADQPVAILTDSDYTNGVLCRGWKAKANVELIRGLKARLAGRSGTAIHWVAGHVGLEGNERADALAGLGVAGESWVRSVDP